MDEREKHIKQITVMRTLDLAYQIFKEETKDMSFESIKEQLIDDFIEWDNGYSISLYNEILKRMDIK